ncbi:hypothetical protein K458DRAFT_468373 [Lentithecium fluviatile CBS 122367]|uniref:Uncharacterized protein n=1 Tax=Lentithecium fluviatile CBS 122367 TaxID=1168545 RepID=A0A6G1IEG0_9PLEO|nr:hypothetical protein K458DRAFT_468373 [Lentithecium fluviatile CBS 122367]
MDVFNIVVDVTSCILAILLIVAVVLLFCNNVASFLNIMAVFYTAMAVIFAIAISYIAIVGSNCPGTLADKCFRFLDLPGELRNRVYEYVLTESKGLDYVHIPGPNGKAILVPHGAAGRTTATEANQLKYVCDQLRMETLGLGLRCNAVHITGPRPGQARDQLDVFFKVRPTVVKWKGNLGVIPAQHPHLDYIYSERSFDSDDNLQILGRFSWSIGLDGRAVMA